MGTRWNCLGTPKHRLWVHVRIPCRGGSNEYPQSMFWSKNKTNRYTPAYPSFCCIKVGFRGKYITWTCFFFVMETDCTLMKIRCITSPLQVHYQSITSLLPICCQCITTLLSDDYQIASLLPECCQLCTSLLPGLDDAGYMLAIHW